MGWSRILARAASVTASGRCPTYSTSCVPSRTITRRCVSWEEAAPLEGLAGGAGCEPLASLKRIMSGTATASDPSGAQPPAALHENRSAESGPWHGLAPGVPGSRPGSKVCQSHSAPASWAGEMRPPRPAPTDIPPKTSPPPPLPSSAPTPPPPRTPPCCPPRVEWMEQVPEQPGVGPCLRAENGLHQRRRSRRRPLRRDALLHASTPKKLWVGSLQASAAGVEPPTPRPALRVLRLHLFGPLTRAGPSSFPIPLFPPFKRTRARSPDRGCACPALGARPWAAPATRSAPWPAQPRRQTRRPPEQLQGGRP